MGRGRDGSGDGWVSEFDRGRPLSGWRGDREAGRTNVRVDIASWPADATVGAEKRGTTQVGGTKIEGGVGIEAGAEVHAGVSLDRDGLTAQVGGSVGVRANADVSAGYGVAEVGASGEVFVGGEAEALVTVGRDGVSAEAGAFVGARAEGEVFAEVSGPRSAWIRAKSSRPPTTGC